MLAPLIGPSHREYDMLDDGLSHRYHLPRGLPVC